MGTKPSNVFTGPPTNNSPNCGSYTVEVINGVPTVVFGTPPANNSSIHIRAITGSVVSALPDGSVFTTTIYDRSVTAIKLDFGVGVADRVPIIDATGKVSAQVFTTAYISDWDTALEATPLSTFAPPEEDIDMQGQKIVDLATGTAGTDAVNKAQMDAAIAAVAGGWRIKEYQYPALDGTLKSITGIDNQPPDIILVSVDLGAGLYVFTNPTIFAPDGSPPDGNPMYVYYANSNGAQFGTIEMSTTATGLQFQKTSATGSAPNLRLILLSANS